MFVAHLDDDEFNETDKDEIDEFAMSSRHGVGIVVPIEVILEGLDCKELRMARKKLDDEIKAAERETPIVGAGRGARKRDMDERVSLYPLTPEQALKGLLETPPAEGTGEG